MIVANDVIAIARSQLGVTERYPNYVFYNDAFYGRPDAGGVNYAWCATFVWWVFNEAKANDLLLTKTARVQTLYEAFAGKHLVHSIPQAGDVCCVKYAGDTIFNHVGIVESVNPSGSVTTIEGNHGDRVARVVRQNCSAYTLAYCRPAYSAEAKEEKEMGIGIVQGNRVTEWETACYINSANDARVYVDIINASKKPVSVHVELQRENGDFGNANFDIGVAHDGAGTDFISFSVGELFNNHEAGTCRLKFKATNPVTIKKTQFYK